jgi:hypothetical protein
MNPKRTGVFVSYSREDESYAKDLCKHLSSVIEEGRLKLWRDVDKIAPGDRWEEEITEAIDEAAVAIALVSADFLASEFVNNVELPALIAAHHDDATIVPVQVRPSTFRHSRLAPFQSINPPEEPLAAMKPVDRETLYARLAERVAQLLQKQELAILQARTTEINERQEKLEFVIKAILSWPELYLLKALNGQEQSDVFDKKYRHQTHLRRLRDLNFIEYTDNYKPVGQLRNGDGLRYFFKLTDDGRKYLKWVEELYPREGAE